MQLFNCGGDWPFHDRYNLILVHENPLWPNYVPQEVHLVNMKLALFSYYIELVFEELRQYPLDVLVVGKG